MLFCAKFMLFLHECVTNELKVRSGEEACCKQLQMVLDEK